MTLEFGLAALTFIFIAIAAYHYFVADKNGTIIFAVLAAGALVGALLAGRAVPAVPPVQFNQQPSNGAGNR